MNGVQPDSSKLRVVQWAAGRIGQSAMRAVINHPDMELVGLYVHSPDKEGKDAGLLAGVATIGVRATRSIDDIIALKPDCILYMQEGFNAEDLSKLLASGINVITTRNEFFYRKAMDSALSEKIQQACLAGGSSMHATGSSPGFITEALPIVLSSLSRELNCITIDEFADIPASTTPDMITNVMGFGQPIPEEFNPAMLAHASVGFSQSLQALADASGIVIDGMETQGEYAAANADIEIPGGAVLAKGSMAAMRMQVSALRGGKPVLVFRANWFCSKDTTPKYDLGDSGWRIQVDSDTPLDVTLQFPRTQAPLADQMSGLTAHRAVNAIPAVVRASPGLKTCAELDQVIARFGVKS